MAAIPTRVLIATDFSDIADRAQGFAETLARAFSAQLHLVHVRVLLDDPYLEEEHEAEIRRLMSSSDRGARRILESGRAGTDEVAVTTHLVRGVSAAEAIIETCAALGCDLLVLGTHGRRGLRKLLLGSVAAEVVRTSPAPVLTVGPGEDHGGGPPRRILVAHDFSEPSHRALRVATEWARRLQAKLTLLHVVEPLVYPDLYAVELVPDELQSRLVERSRNALQEVADGLPSEVSTEVEVRTGRAGEVITGCSHPSQTDLVVMGNRGLNALEHLLLGSAADVVLRRSQAPLLTVRTDPSS